MSDYDGRMHDVVLGEFQPGMSQFLIETTDWMGMPAVLIGLQLDQDAGGFCVESLRRRINRFGCAGAVDDGP